MVPVIVSGGVEVGGRVVRFTNFDKMSGRLTHDTIPFPPFRVFTPYHYPPLYTTEMVVVL